jgi:hypothetical protein
LKRLRKCRRNWRKAMTSNNVPSDEDISKTYISDDEHVDKWNNLEKACWAGYKQVGMKDKGGKRVPNCVPINKATGLPEEPETSWNGVFRPKVD